MKSLVLLPSTPAGHPSLHLGMLWQARQRGAKLVQLWMPQPALQAPLLLLQSQRCQGECVQLMGAALHRGRS